MSCVRARDQRMVRSRPPGKTPQMAGFQARLPKNRVSGYPSATMRSDQRYVVREAIRRQQGEPVGEPVREPLRRDAREYGRYEDEQPPRREVREYQQGEYREPAPPYREPAPGYPEPAPAYREPPAGYREPPVTYREVGATYREAGPVYAPRPAPPYSERLPDESYRRLRRLRRPLPVRRGPCIRCARRTLTVAARSAHPTWLSPRRRDPHMDPASRRVVQFASGRHVARSGKLPSRTKTKKTRPISPPLRPGLPSRERPPSLSVA